MSEGRTWEEIQQFLQRQTDEDLLLLAEIFDDGDESLISTSRDIQSECCELLDRRGVKSPEVTEHIQGKFRTELRDQIRAHDRQISRMGASKKLILGQASFDKLKGDHLFRDERFYDLPIEIDPENPDRAEVALLNPWTD